MMLQRLCRTLDWLWYRSRAESKPQAVLNTLHPQLHGFFPRETKEWAIWGYLLRQPSLEKDPSPKMSRQEAEALKAAAASPSPPKGSGSTWAESYKHKLKLTRATRNNQKTKHSQKEPALRAAKNWQLQEQLKNFCFYKSIRFDLRYFWEFAGPQHCPVLEFSHNELKLSSRSENISSTKTNLVKKTVSDHSIWSQIISLVPS